MTIHVQFWMMCRYIVGFRKSASLQTVGKRNLPRVGNSRRSAWLMAMAVLFDWMAHPSVGVWISTIRLRLMEVARGATTSDKMCRLRGPLRRSAQAVCMHAHCKKTVLRSAGELILIG